MKRLRQVVKIFLVFFLLVCNISFAIVKPTSEFYVNDYADILSDDTEKYIVDCNVKLYEKTGAQIVVVTIPSLGGAVLEEYANELFNNFGIGSREKNNGVLLLLALEERLFRVEVGYGLEGALPDGKTGRIQDEYIIPYLKNDEWDKGIRNGFNAILEVVEKEYNVEISEEEAIESYSGDADKTAVIWTFFIGCVAGIFICILSKAASRKGRKLTSVMYLIYLIFSPSIVSILNGEIGAALFMGHCFAIICTLGGSGHGYYGGGYSGGGGRRRLLRRWRIFWWWRKFKKLLILNKLYIYKGGICYEKIKWGNNCDSNNSYCSCISSWSI